MASLPDKGKKILEFHRKAVERLKSRELVEETTSLLSKLNLSRKMDLSHPMVNFFFKLQSMSIQEEKLL